MGCDDAETEICAPKVVEVRVSPPFSQLTVINENDPTATAATTTAVSIKFDRYMFPPNASRQGICLEPQHVDKPTNTLADCQAPHPLSATYDPVTRTATYYLRDMQELKPDVPYQLTIFRAGDGTGFSSFDGVSLDRNYTYVFKTVKGTGAIQAPPTDDFYCACDRVLSPMCTLHAQNVIAKSCPGCHQDTSVMDGSEMIPVAASMGMNLTVGAGKVSTEGLVQTVIGVTAHETEIGGHGQVSTDNPLRFGAGMARVAPSQPGNSYLLYKMLAAEGVVTDTTLAPHETERLRLGLVVGQPMPVAPYSVTIDDIETLSTWIAAGAHTSECK